MDTSNRIISYDIHDLGAQLKPAGLLTITDAMLNRVTVNWKKGKRTHLFVDEFHIVYENEYSGNFFTSAWRQFRKRNAYPCAITQNVEYLLDSVQASTMLSNSEFIVMLNQAASDREKLSQLLNISPEQMSYVTGADAGCGLMRYGNSLVPFINRFPRNTELYKLITTKPGEGIFGDEAAEQPAPAEAPMKKPAQRKTPAKKPATTKKTAAAKTTTRKAAQKKDADSEGGAQ